MAGELGRTLEQFLIGLILKNRDFFVSIGNFSSERTEVTCGSILGPLLFNVCTSSGFNNNIGYHSYVDDTQLYSMMSLGDSEPDHVLNRCFEQINFFLLSAGRKSVFYQLNRNNRDK